MLLLNQLVAILSWCFFAMLALFSSYWFLLAAAAIRPPRRKQAGAKPPTTRFAITIPAHNEESVIASTVERLRALDYPHELFEIHIAADHCSDQTAAYARKAGAIVHERNEGPRTGKGAVLAWLFERVLQDLTIDAVAIFDADTQVDSAFLRVMDAHITAGDQVIQGQHRISNPDQGWFSSLTWAMFIVDNRFQNLGRTNLGWSAKHMGDSICFRSGVLRKLGWGEGLTEDYQLRQRLLLSEIKIAYEPEAIGYGEAPTRWTQARAQRARWLKGTQDANRQFAAELLKASLRLRDGALLDGALQAWVPSYSTITLAGAAFFFLHLGVYIFLRPVVLPASLIAWGCLVGLLWLYPFWGLLLEKAPVKAFIAFLLGPAFIFWRTALALQARFSGKNITWVRTAHGGQK